MDFRQQIITSLVQATGRDEQQIAPLCTTPPDPALGDYAFPCFIFGKNPHQAAEEIQKKITLPQGIAKVEVTGPYLNFFLNQEIVVKEILTAIYTQAKRYGQGTLTKNAAQRIVVEYCGPNTNKPLHLGHLRNMALGNALCRVLSFAGQNVSPVNIINDRGVHICKSMLAYQRWGQGQQPDKKGDHFVGDFYVQFDKAAKEEEEQGKDTLQTEVQEMLVKWEQGDEETRKLWKTMNSWVLQGFAQTYRRFGISFEKEYFESDYYERGKGLVEEGLKKKIFINDAKGGIIAPLKTYGLSDKVLLRGDKTSIYITQDIFLATLRYRDFKFHQMIYVTASEQRLHFQQLFRILELLGMPYARNMYHLSYGMVHLPSGRMKSREGTVVDADDVLNEVAGLAAQEVRQRHVNLGEEEIQRRAEVIALGAIKFFMVHTDAVRDIIYHPEASLSFEGETGPYLQYTHARACSILRKARELGLSWSPQLPHSLITLPEELAVVRQLALFPEVVEKAAETYKLHGIATYLITLAQVFNTFYHHCPVLSEEKTLSKVRLLLVDGVRQVLANGLGLLGITALEEM